VTANTDGRLLVRYELGLRDTALTAGNAVGATCGRCTAAAIGGYLQTMTR